MVRNPDNNNNRVSLCPECDSELILQDNTNGDDSNNKNNGKSIKKIANLNNSKKSKTNLSKKSQYLDIERQDQLYNQTERQFQNELHNRLNQLIERQRENQEAKQMSKIDSLFSTKVKTLLGDIQNDLIDNEDNADEKCLIVSQWTSMLDLIEESLKQNHWVKNTHYVRYDGRCSHQQKDKAIKQLNEDDDVRVMLVSLKSGGVGLNLTRANRVYMVDPWWNEASEVQAEGRVHRIGQTREVFVKRYIMNNSIEIRILELQESKNEIANALLSDDYDPTKPFKNFKLNVEDIKLLFKGFKK